MNVLVTGATGFVGGHVVERLLAAGHQVVAATRRPCEVPGARVIVVSWDAPSLTRAVEGVDAVVHVAGGGKPPAGQDVEAALHHQNVGLTARLLERVGDRRLVFVSSIAAHGPSADGQRPAPDAPAAPISAYGRSKLEAERLVAGAANAVTLRPPPVYGPGDKNFRPLFRAAARGFLPVVSRSSRTSLIHVRDLADATVAAVSSDVTGTWFVDDGEVHTWGQIADVLGEIVGRRVRAVPIPTRALPWVARVNEALSARSGGIVFLSTDKARDLAQPHWVCGQAPPAAMGWAPRIALDSGFRETESWYAADRRATARQAP